MRAVTAEWGSSCARFGHEFDRGELHARFCLRVAVDPKEKDPQLDGEWLEEPEDSKTFDEHLRQRRQTRRAAAAAAADADATATATTAAASSSGSSPSPLPPSLDEVHRSLITEDAANAAMPKKKGQHGAQQHVSASKCQL